MLLLCIGCKKHNKSGDESESIVMSSKNVASYVTSSETQSSSVDSEINKTESKQKPDKITSSTQSVVQLESNISSLGSSMTISDNDAITENDADVYEFPLSNCHKLLINKKRLTIGYLGGSITLASSAVNNGGSMEKSWVNLTSSWFKQKYPNAFIETVNSGISDTATNFALFRLEKTLMDENYNNIPDLVFVEFTTNDWTYQTQTVDDLKIQIESLFLNIYKYNPYAEIVVIVTVRSEDTSTRQAYLEVASHYNIPVIDVGIPMQQRMDERGVSHETEGNYYYTIDDLHPSWRGYEIYFEEIKKNLLNKYLNDTKVESTKLYPYGKKLPKALRKNLITSPRILTAKDLILSNRINVFESPLYCGMYELTDSFFSFNSTSTVKAKFKGSTLGILFNMNTSDIKMAYSIDGGEQKMFRVDNNNFGFQRYHHPQVFMLAHNLSSGEHTVEINFVVSSYANEITVGGLLVNG